MFMRFMFQVKIYYFSLFNIKYGKCTPFVRKEEESMSRCFIVEDKKDFRIYIEWNTKIRGK